MPCRFRKTHKDCFECPCPRLFKGRLSIPVIGAPLFIISVPDLVIAQCKAGVVGSFPALNARPPALLDEWLARIKEELAAYDKAHPERRRRRLRSTRSCTSPTTGSIRTLRFARSTRCR